MPLSASFLSKIRSAFAFAALALGVSLGCLSAAETAPDLRTARIEYRRDLLKALLPEKKAHLEALSALERRLAAKGDYAGAQRARDDRSALEQELKTMEREIPALTAQAQSLRNGPLPERILFQPKEAQVQKLALDEKANALANWEPQNAAARWTLPNLPSGGYEVLITYTCPAQVGATLEVKEAFYSLRGDLEPTDKPLEKNIGTLRIRDGKSGLTLSAIKNDAGDKLRILSVALLPAGR